LAIPQPWAALNDDYRPETLDALIRSMVGGDIDEDPDSELREQQARLRAAADARTSATKHIHDPDHWGDRFRD
jgi:hypothetical protein